MKTMKFNALLIEQEMGRKIYFKNEYAIVAKYYSSQFWNPFDWYIVKIDKE